MLEVWLPLLAILALTTWWYHVLRLRERATARARRVCEQLGLQLLDDSVALHRLRLNWRRGPLHVTREYRFDTSLGGNDRRTASITLLGNRIVSASLPEGVPVDPATTTSVRVSYGIPLPTPGRDGGSNVIPISRARRTLH